MKNRISGLFAGLAVLVFAANAHAVTIDFSVVGPNVDPATAANAKANLGNSSNAAEDAWVESLIGPAGYVKFNIGGSAWMEVIGATEPAGTNLYAFDFGVPPSPGANPTHFLVKTGNLQGGVAESHFLFTNLSSTRYGVVNLNQFHSTGLNIDIGKFSHSAAIFAGGTQFSVVPDGGSTLMLLGAAMGALGMARRRFGRS